MSRFRDFKINLLIKNETSIFVNKTRTLKTIYLVTSTKVPGRPKENI